MIPGPVSTPRDRGANDAIRRGSGGNVSRVPYGGGAFTRCGRGSPAVFFLGAGKDGGAGPLRRRPLRRAPAASDVTSALSIQPRGWGCHIPARGDDACGSRAGSAGQTKREELLFVYANLAAMSAPLRRSWTQDEFFAWAGSQEGRYEFDGFQPVAMTGGTVNHALI